jgi:O-acetyl-ADP-ribose deacetylase (regulator of RNase III)
MLLLRGDLTTMEVDAIVNSANNDLLLGGGVSGAISRVAGPAVQEECHKIGTIPLGTAVATGAGNLRAKWIVHAAVNPLGLWADAKSVRNAARAALRKADELGAKRVAFPAIGTGTGGLPVERCADILIEEVQKHGEGTTGIEEVHFVLYDEKPFAIFEERYNERVLGKPPADAGDPRFAAPPAPPPKAPEPRPPAPPPPEAPGTSPAPAV